MNFISKVPNSHYWNSLQMILAYKELYTVDYLIIGLKNCLEHGYQLQRVQPANHEGRHSGFISIENMIQYLENYIGDDLLDFYLLLIKTLDDGLDLSNGLKSERSEVYRCIDGERNYQDAQESQRDFPDQEKSVAEWLNYIEFHLERAKHRVYQLNKQEALHEIRKVAALAVRALEIHGCPQRQPKVDVGETDDNGLGTEAKPYNGGINILDDNNTGGTWTSTTTSAMWNINSSSNKITNDGSIYLPNKENIDYDTRS